VAVGLFAKADKEDQPDIYGRNTGTVIATGILINNQAAAVVLKPTVQYV
jgi:hypothetical protein